MWYIAPELLDSTAIRYLTGIVAILWSLELYFYRQLGELTKQEGLNARQRERLLLRTSEIRRRVYWIGCIGLATSILLWTLASFSLPSSSPLYAALTGVLVGISISYIVLLPSWFEEISDFVDRIRHSEQTSKQRDAAVKKFDEKKK